MDVMPGIIGLPLIGSFVFIGMLFGSAFWESDADHLFRLSEMNKPPVMTSPVTTKTTQSQNRMESTSDKTGFFALFADVIFRTQLTF